MSKTRFQIDPKVQPVFNSYPEDMKQKLLFLRGLIIDIATETESIKELEETLKWGEPSYLTKYGSTIRLAWKAKSPNQYAIYFKCTSTLVSTFKIVYKNTFKFEGTRAIIFNLEDKIPTEALKNCIKAALTYHKVKQLPLLDL